MKDNDLINLVAGQLESASVAAGWNYIVIQKNEPTQQGVPTAASIFFEKLFDKPYGHPSHSLAINDDIQSFTSTEEQWYETHFQVSTLVTQDPENLSLPTASDVANYLKMYIASRQSRSVFMAENVGTLRVTEVRNPYFENDKHRMEAHPSFDIVFTHIRDIEFQVPGTNIVEGTVIEGIDSVGVFPVVP